jgi:hypothetical protein
MMKLKSSLFGFFLLLLCTIAGFGECHGQSVSARWKPTNARLLSVNSPTKDEDPTIICGQNGTVFVAWFSDRGGNPDIYLTATNNGTDWTQPVRVTNSPAGDFYPNLFQDYEGVFHIVWFRWTAPFRGNIWHNTSLDGLTWNPQTEEPVTTEADVDDWVPTITQAPDRTLLVFFVSARRNPANSGSDIYLATKRPGQSQWNRPVLPAGINSVSEHDQLPFAMQTGDKLTLVWVRHDTSAVLPWTNPKSDLFYSISADGQHWSTASQITREAGNVVNLFPAIYAREGNEWFFVWLSNKPGRPVLFELPLANAELYPTSRVKNKRFGIGYSHRIAPTPTRGVYIGVWTEGPEGTQDIFYRLFRRH